MKNKILLIVGSHREKSFNNTLAIKIQQLLKEKNIEVDFLNFKNLPLLNQDTEFTNNSEITKIREKVKNYNALIVFSPEYNSSYPAILKNLFDWLSRPENPNDRKNPTVINNKKIAITSIAGANKGSFVRQNLTNLLKTIKMNVMNDSLGLSVPSESWSSNVINFDSEQNKEIEKFVNKFLDFIK